MRTIIIFSWAAIFFALVLVPDCRAKESAARETAVVRSVVDGDTVVMASPIGRAHEIRLVGIQAPKLPLGRPHFKKWPLADQAKAALEALSLGKKILLSFGGRRMDRHGRLLAHLYTESGVWIQGKLLTQGMARVYSFADNRAEISEMLAREKSARDNRLGIWSHPFYQIRKSDDLSGRINGFQLVEGRVLDVAKVRKKIFLNFGANWRTDFTITIAGRAVRLFGVDTLDPMTLKGKRIRVRGWLKSYNGPMINATHPEQIEVLEK